MQSRCQARRLTASIDIRLRRNAAAEYSGGAAEAECGGIPRSVKPEYTDPCP
jgi:hypothetical protein